MKQYVVDAFADRIFSGNPAAVCVAESWPGDDLMRDIARENNLSETAFLVKEGEQYRLRWFTPGGEIDLCGHATLASAYVILNHVEKALTSVTFTTISGSLTVKRRGELYEMNFPKYDLAPVEVTEEITAALGKAPKEAYMGRDLLCVFDDKASIVEMKPDLEKLKAIDGLLLHVTAPSDNEDCISRSFGPKLGIDEDPVCGSGHCHIIPYWADRLGKAELMAYQASERGGRLYCRLEGSRVILAGKAVLFSAGEICI